MLRKILKHYLSLYFYLGRKLQENANIPLTARKSWITSWAHRSWGGEEKQTQRKQELFHFWHRTEGRGSHHKGRWDETTSFAENSFFFFKILFIFRQRRREGGRERETSMCGCLSLTPYWGPGLQPRHVPWSGIRTCNPLVCRLALNPLRHTSQGRYFKEFLKAENDSSEILKTPHRKKATT